MKKKEEDYTVKIKFGRNYIRIELKVTQPGGTFVKYLQEAFTRSYTHHTQLLSNIRLLIVLYYDLLAGYVIRSPAEYTVYRKMARIMGHSGIIPLHSYHRTVTISSMPSSN